jgi:hypothetical protein
LAYGFDEGITGALRAGGSQQLLGWPHHVFGLAGSYKISDSMQLAVEYQQSQYDIE